MTTLVALYQFRGAANLFDGARWHRARVVGQKTAKVEPFFQLPDFGTLLALLPERLAAWPQTKDVLREGARAMKRMLLGLVAVAVLITVPAAAQAGHGHGYGHGGGYRGGYGGGHGWDDGYGGGGWSSGYRGGPGGWGGPGCYHRPPRCAYRPPVRVYRPVYPFYGGPNTSFYYNGPNSSFGFGF